MTDDFKGESIDNIDDSFEVDMDDNGKSAIQSIVPFFQALSTMRKEGLIKDEDTSFKRDVEFEKLIMDPNFNPENLTESEIVKLNSYMTYIQSVIMDDDKDKLLKAVKHLNSKKKKKQRWRDIKKK